MKGYLLVLLALACTVSGTQWAVLLAGSDGWRNYRHQADVCHAYQLLTKNGFDKENIITFMTDDIANNERNPNKGQIINRPNGTNVYEGVVIDYKGKDVTVKNFLNVLLGNKTAMENVGSGKVLNSGEDDVVFLNMVDHGGSGVFCFPRGELYASQLNNVFKKMKELNKFKSLVLYVESCYSGSMFDNITSQHDNVFVSTAAAGDESSYAYYLDDTLETYLADVYSAKWMERMEEKNFSETFFEQFDAVRTATTKSHVNIYGDFSVGLHKFNSSSNAATFQPNNNVIKEKDMYNNEDLPLIAASKKIKNSETYGEYTKNVELYDQLVKNRDFGDELISKIFEKFTEGDENLKSSLVSLKPKTLNEGIFECYSQIIETFDNHCLPVYENTYFLQHIYKFANVCLKELDGKKMIEDIETVCNGTIPDNILII